MEGTQALGLSPSASPGPSALRIPDPERPRASGREEVSLETEQTDGLCQEAQGEFFWDFSWKLTIKEKTKTKNEKRFLYLMPSPQESQL